MSNIQRKQRKYFIASRRPWWKTCRKYFLWINYDLLRNSTEICEFCFYFFIVWISGNSQATPLSTDSIYFFRISFYLDISISISAEALDIQKEGGKHTPPNLHSQSKNKLTFKVNSDFCVASRTLLRKSLYRYWLSNLFQEKEMLNGKLLISDVTKWLSYTFRLFFLIYHSDWLP